LQEEGDLRPGPSDHIGRLDANLGWIEHVYDGWRPLLERLLLAISRIDPTLRVVDAKQKFGSLRVRLDRYDERAYALIDEATSESLKTCEHCGGVAALRNDGGYFVTLCDRHAGGSERVTTPPTVSIRLIRKRK
jgi:hypothetical protein